MRDFFNLFWRNGSSQGKSTTEYTESTELWRFSLCTLCSLWFLKPEDNKKFPKCYGCILKLKFIKVKGTECGIKEQTMDRLRNYLVKKYQGKIWGKVSSELEEIINAHIDKVEGRAKGQKN